MVKSGTVELRIEANPDEMWVSAQEMRAKGKATLKKPMKCKYPPRMQVKLPA